jgi:hypothetical protein
LDIINATIEDSGSYTCVAIREDDDEILQEAVSLTVTDRAGVDLEVGGEPCPGIAVENRKDAVFKCTLCGFKIPGFSFTWERVGAKIAEDRAHTKDCHLVISNVTVQDAGNYTCVATFKSSAVLRETIPLCVKGPPRVLNHTPDLVIRVGQSVELQCAGEGPPVPKVYWTKGFVRLSDIGMGTVTLTIANATYNDSGDYFCHADNYLGNDVKGAKLVVSKLEFRARSPAEIDVDVSQTVAMDCTASDAPDLPLVYTQWMFPSPCAFVPDSPEVLPNGTLIISQTTLQHTGVYTCKAYNQKETISMAVHLHVSSSDDCDEWMLKADDCKGFRQSSYNKSVYYAVSASTTWDKYKYYQCPRGYHWACTEEGRRIFQSNTGVSVYSSQCGWSGYNFRGSTRYYFRFRDSAKTSAYKHAGHRDGYEVQTGYDRSSFAGVVCIKD